MNHLGIADPLKDVLDALSNTPVIKLWYMTFMNFCLVCWTLVLLLLLLFLFFFWMQEEFAFYEVNDPFVQNFITSLDSILTSFKVCLHRLPSDLVS